MVVGNGFVLVVFVFECGFVDGVCDVFCVYVLGWYDLVVCFGDLWWWGDVVCWCYYWIGWFFGWGVIVVKGWCGFFWLLVVVWIFYVLWEIFVCGVLWIGCYNVVGMYYLFWIGDCVDVGLFVGLVF